jgi:hypothetical protein
MTVKTDAWQDLMDTAYDKWQDHREWSHRQLLMNLDAAERKAVLLGNFHYQTCNGGLQQWVENGYACSGPDLLTILEEMDTENSRRVAGIVRTVLGYVDLSQENRGCGGNYWTQEWSGPDEDEEVPACFEEVDRLTDEYYSFYDEFVVEVEQYLGH